jgi:iron-sulfur cluster repair protein YtfE (RIC family)
VREREVLVAAKERARRAVRQARTAALRERIIARFRGEHRERIDLLNTLILRYNYIAPTGAQRTFPPYSIKNEMALLDADLAQT